MEKSSPKHSFLILILGALTALSPFSIDMYLPAFPKMAEDLHTNIAQVSLSLSSYFVGLAIGQLFYGPLLDRFGRKKPLYFGLGLYLLATVGCLFSHSIDNLIAFRLIQALGGCAANVAAIAMVRDFFTPKESAKVFSLLVLILGVSPLLAPTAGGILSSTYGWPSIFIALFIIGLLILLLAIFYLPQGREADPSHPLQPVAIVKNYFSIFLEPQFYTYTFAGSMAFSGLFVYLAGSPTIFMEVFKVSEQVYGWIFGFLAAGFIGASQLNILLLKRFGNEKILLFSLAGLTFTGFVFALGAYNNWWGIISTIALLFVFLGFAGLANPNASALAMAPFERNAGSASALMGSLQMGIGALVSITVGVMKAQQLFPITVVFAGSASLALLILVLGSRRIPNKVEAPDSDGSLVAH
ncbi:multidrug effflux MFS transporter [Bdellovibrio sp. 22V]|uniref:multidrug effflux MFS transporter n=1 Tax=Bdellovibrio sp. 22V TaxID=3044166 RepID=UPI002542BD7F|nr:multidrug effflux MFS transporter [Bdellovibrio sp. 22V]WII72131.1 multidrug effflux MFS transporter [Bdellovibrio sp. 22V]